MPYVEFYGHIVWTTKNREPLLVGECAGLVEQTIRVTCREQGVIVHALGMMPDHLHMAVSLPPRVAVAELMQLLKGRSSYQVNHPQHGKREIPFAWQSEYGLLSFGKRSLGQVVAYVENQAERHATGNILPALDRISSLPQIPPDQ